MDGASEEVAFARLLGQEGNSCESLGRTCPGRGNRMYGKGKSLSCYPHFTDEDTKAQRGGVVRSRLGLRFFCFQFGHSVRPQATLLVVWTMVLWSRCSH